MRAFHANCVRLAENLDRGGYLFESPPLETPLPDRAATVAKLKELGAALPSALLSFYDIVGAVEFVGRPPRGWHGCNFPDPVSIVSLDPQYWSVEVERWQEDRDEDFGGRFSVQVAGDHIHKSGFSGGAYYVIFDNPHDPTFWMPDAQMRFKDYLRLCVRWGGFPGLRHAASHSWPLAQIKNGAEELP